MEKVRLGIIGIGSMGTGHAGNVLKGMVPDMELTAVADIWQSRLDWQGTIFRRRSRYLMMAGK